MRSIEWEHTLLKPLPKTPSPAEPKPKLRDMPLPQRWAARGWAAWSSAGYVGIADGAW